MMRVGDLVKYCGDGKDVSGIIKERISRRWVLVVWGDKVVLAEHVDDLQVVSAAP